MYYPSTQPLAQAQARAQRGRRPSTASHYSFAASLRSLRSVHSISTTSILSTISAYGHLTPLSGLGARVPVRGRSSVSVLNHNLNGGRSTPNASHQPSALGAGASKISDAAFAPAPAPAEISLSRTVHECYVAGRYRQLSRQYGLSLPSTVDLSAGEHEEEEDDADHNSGSDNDEEELGSVTADDATAALALSLDLKREEDFTSSAATSLAVAATRVAEIQVPSESDKVRDAAMQTQTAARLLALLSRDTATRSKTIGPASEGGFASARGTAGGRWAREDDSEQVLGQDRRAHSVAALLQNKNMNGKKRGAEDLRKLFPPASDVTAKADAALHLASGQSQPHAANGCDGHSHFTSPTPITESDPQNSSASSKNGKIRMSKSGTVGTNKNSSKRAYAASRIKAATVFKANLKSAAPADVTRLEWEIKALTPITPAHRLLPLLKRAAELRSLRSITQLAALYTLGVTRGHAPIAVELVRRDAPRALSWAVRGLGFALGRHGASTAVDGGSSSVRPVESKEQSQQGAENGKVLAATAAAGSDEEEEEKKEAIFMLLHLLARVARSKKAAWPAMSLSSPNGSHSVEQVDAESDTNLTKLWRRVEELLPSMQAYLKDQEGVSASGDGDVAAADGTGAVSFAAALTTSATVAGTDDVPDPPPQQPPEADGDLVSLLAGNVSSKVAEKTRECLSVLDAARKELAFLEALVSLRKALLARAGSEKLEGRGDVDEVERKLDALQALPGCKEQMLKEKAEAVLSTLSALDEKMLAVRVAAFRDALAATLPEESVTENASEPQVVTAASLGLGLPHSKSTNTTSPNTSSGTAFEPIHGKSAGAASITASHATASPSTIGKMSNDASALLTRQHAASAKIRDEAPFDPFFIEHTRGKNQQSITSNAYLNPPSPTASIRSISSAWGYGEDDEEGEPKASAGYSFPRLRRPSSVISDSPSLMFPSHGEDASEDVMQSPLTPSFAPPERPSLRNRSQSGLPDRRRVVSMYGEPSVAVSPSLHLPMIRPPASSFAPLGSSKSSRRLSFLLPPTVASPHAADHAFTAIGTVGRAQSHASQSLRQFAAHSPHPINPATKLMRSKGSLRPRPLSMINSASEPALDVAKGTLESSTSIETLAKHALALLPMSAQTPAPLQLPAGRQEAVMQETRLPPPSPARSTASGRAFSGLDPTNTSYGHSSHASSANSSQVDIAALAKQPSVTVNGLDNVLAAAEDQSKLRTGGCCANCGKAVVNGAMNRKGEILCGRSCRLETKAKSAPVAA
ncbi:hypothetical protein K437DRAFT_268897 [Tilletiaria anomala UBC 951]|uniref:Uncharacterized protein n=1 Tax=Tilletiaria anomala (strain ATCC 24038 / CBS 436.72 / UBC 951) TaxID=1037660 RepID=A0A066VRF1_TILAU|nr:uncharacterized protein K437DRAFT_268897 [Tilletiaria anomala UBC 951]KDN44061.1 hypothetical protein K437DRAFT_268897 [Tilletiaria anomala UBC 951]